MAAMGRFAVGLGVLVAACATAQEASDPQAPSFVLNADYAGAGGIAGVNHEVVWQAACRAMAWEGGLIRVDSRIHRVGLDDVMEVDVVPYPDGSTGIFFVADTSRGGDFTPEIFWCRFHQALDILKSGKPLPLDPPPLPAEKT